MPSSISSKVPAMPPNMPSDMPSGGTKHAVALCSCSSYAAQQVEESVRHILYQSGLLKEHTDQSPTSALTLRRGMQVLVKPNLLRAHALSCTHPQVVRAVCLCLQEQGIKVVVADSPGFGSARKVAQGIGLSQALAPLGITVQEFQKVQAIPLCLSGQNTGSSSCSGHTTQAGHWGIAREALEADAILSLPRFKVHSQMRLTLGVKNTFGCIVGLRKAMAHAVQGRELTNFCHGIMALYQALPPTAALVDGITAMHKTGPSGGEPYSLHMLGASPSAMALDTALYSLLQLQAQDIPLWHTAQELGMPEAFEHNIHYTGAKPPHIYPSNNSTAFQLPQELMDICFQPHRLLYSFMKRLWSRAF